MLLYEMMSEKTENKVDD